MLWELGRFGIVDSARHRNSENIFCKGNTLGHKTELAIFFSSYETMKVVGPVISNIGHDMAGLQPVRGNSLYTGSPDGRAYTVSYNRPFTKRRNVERGLGIQLGDPMVRWLERMVMTSATRPASTVTDAAVKCLKHKVFLSVGHDEYWSGQRANVTAARDGASISHSSAAMKVSGRRVGAEHRRLLDAISNVGPTRKRMPSQDRSTDRPRGPAHGVTRGLALRRTAAGPENGLTGRFSWSNSGTTEITVPTEDGKLRFWRNTTVATLPSESEPPWQRHTRIRMGRGPG